MYINFAVIIWSYACVFTNCRNSLDCSNLTISIPFKVHLHWCQIKSLGLHLPLLIVSIILLSDPSFVLYMINFIWSKLMNSQELKSEHSQQFPFFISGPNSMCDGKYDGNYEYKLYRADKYDYVYNPHYFLQCSNGLAYCQACWPLRLEYSEKCDQCLYSKHGELLEYLFPYPLQLLGVSWFIFLQFHISSRYLCHHATMETRSKIPLSRSLPLKGIWIQWKHCW